MASLGHPERF
jgi:hypothetical protein